MAKDTKASVQEAQASPVTIKQKVITIAARKDGFRRAGFAHPASAVDHPLDRFTPEQLAALKAETMLIVQEREIEVSALEAAPANDI